MFLEEPLLAIFAHPDDESFLAGGTLAMAAKRTGVKIIIATRGEKGRSHIDYEISDEGIAELRAKETEKAMKMLGIEDYEILNYPDGTLGEADEHKTVSKLIGFMRDFKPSSVLTFGPDGVTGHRDHIAIGRFATEAAKACGIDVYWLARPGFQQSMVNSRDWKRTKKFYDEIPPVPYAESELIRVDVSQVIDQKKKAIAAHASQGSKRYLIPEADGLIRHEYFYKVEKVLET